MATIPAGNHDTVAQIYRAYEAKAEDPRRPHLGASLIGHPCERYLWLTFRWVGTKTHSGRLLRLFETGQLEERRLVDNLKSIGVEVHDTDAGGKQWRVSAIGGHFGGSMDGVCKGLPEAPKTWHVLEFKTHNEKSFKDLIGKGVGASKHQHWAQMQVYMGLGELKRALYMAVNKNDDTVYMERVEADKEAFTELMNRAERVIRAAEPPLRISNDPAWWQCKMCDFYEHCHGTEVPAVNCRTCAHSTPVVDGEDGKWTCEHFGEVGLIAQREAQECPSHRFIPIMLERVAEQTGYVNGDVEYTLRDTGERFKNGEATDAFSSKEIRAVKDIRALGGSTGQFKAALAAEGMASEVVE
jgi:hypothetical protein